MSTSRKPVANPRRTKVVGPDGRKIDLSSLPLVAYTLNCGHLGRDYGIARNDLVFCPDCKTTKKVTKILAS